MRFATRGPQIICLCAGICNLVDGLRGLLRFRPRRRGCGVCIGRTLSLERDAPPQQGTSQPKLHVGKQSADIEVVAAQIRLRDRDQASKKWPTSRVNSEVKTLNTLRPTVKCSLSVCLPVFLSVCLPACLPVCLSVCLSVCLYLSLSHCLSVSLSVCQVCPCTCRSGVWCEVLTRSQSLFGPLLSLHIPLRPSLTTLHAPWMTIDERYGKENEQQHHFPHPSDHALLREAGKWKPLLVLKSFFAQSSVMWNTISRETRQEPSPEPALSRPTFDLSHIRDVVGHQAAVLNSVRLPTSTEGGVATAISYQSIVCSSRSSPQAWPSVCGCTRQTCDVKDVYSLKSLSFSLSKQFRPFFVDGVPSGMKAHLRLLVRGFVQSQRESKSS